MDWIDLLKQSPSTIGCIIAITLFLRAMKDRDQAFLTAFKQIHDDNREDKEIADKQAGVLFERNIDALSKNTVVLEENKDALNEAKLVIYSVKRGT